jgi:hypothetical protein
VAHCSLSGLALAPGSDPETASSSLRGASSWRTGHPVVARGGLRRVNWRWPQPPRPAHDRRLPGQPVRTNLRHAKVWIRLRSARFTACRAKLVCELMPPSRVSPPSALPIKRSKALPNQRSVPQAKETKCGETAVSISERLEVPLIQANHPRDPAEGRGRHLTNRWRET